MGKKQAEKLRKTREIMMKKKAGLTVEEELEEDEDDVEVKMDEEELQVELSDQEKNMWYRKAATPDLNEAALSSSFAGFSLPSAEEGFDSIRFDWKPEGDCTKMLKDWILEKKLTQRVDDLKPGAWFQEQWT